MRRQILIFLILCWFSIDTFGQQHEKDSVYNDANEYMHQSSHEELVAIFDSEKEMHGKNLLSLLIF